MSCTVKYENGRVSQVLEDGKVSQVFKAIDSVIKNKDKSFLIYNKINEGVKDSARENLESVPATKEKVEIGSTEFTESVFINEQIGMVEDGEPRSEQRIGTSEVNMSNVKTIKLLQGLQRESTDKESIKTKIKELNTNGRLKLNSKVKVRIDTPLQLGVTEDQNYGLVTQGEVVASAEMQGNNLQSVKVLEAVEGQGLARVLMLNIIKERALNDQELTINVKGQDGFLDNLVFNGILTKSKGSYKLNPSKVGGIKEAISSLNQNNEDLTVEEKPSVRNLMYRFGTETTQDLKDKLKRLEVEGILVFTEDNLNKVFDKYESNRIAKDPEIQDQLTSIYNKLQSSNFEIDFDPMFKARVSSDILGGATLMENPNQVEANIQKLVAGESNPIEALPDNYLDIASTKEGAAYIKRMSEEYGKAQVQTITSDGQLVTSKGDTNGKFNLILDYRSSATATVALDVLDGLTGEQYEASAANIIKIALQEIGIDTNTFEQKINTLEDLLQAEELLTAIEEGNFNKASEIYDQLLNDKQNDVEVVRGAENTDVFIENTKGLSEIEIMNNFGLIKVQENHYKQFEDISVEEMISMAEDSELNPDNLEGQEFVDYLYKQATSMELVGDRMDLIKNYLFKTSAGISIEPNTVKSQPKNTINDVEFSEYIREDFIKDFNYYLNESNNQDFKITGKGIEFVYKDAISQEEAIEKLPEQLRKDLIEYSKISKHMDTLSETMEKALEDMDSLLLYPSRESNIEHYFPGVEDRVKAYNFPESLKKLSGEYKNITTTIGERLIVKPNEFEKYLNHNGVTLERVAFEKGLGIFKEAPATSEVFIETDLEGVTLETDMTELTQLATTAKETKINNFFESNEKNEIEDEYFKC